MQRRESQASDLLVALAEKILKSPRGLARIEDDVERHGRKFAGDRRLLPCMFRCSVSLRTDTHNI